MPGSDFSATQKSAKTDSQAFSPEVVNKYWGIVIFGILTVVLCSIYLYSIVNTALTTRSRNSRLLLATHMYFFTFLAAWAYWLTHRTAAPKIPSRYHFTDEEWRTLKEKNFDFKELQNELSSMARKRGVRTRTDEGQVNACKHCWLIKPERTHHCSVCKICIVKMDHHCPWFGNCIHHGNFKFFLQAIFYSVLGMVYMLVTSLVMLLITDGGMERIKATTGAMLSFCLLFIVALGISVPTGGFFGAQVYHVMRNMTTLESMKGAVYFADGAEDSYDLGSSRLNLVQQLGPVVLAWFIPIKSTPGDGTQFLLRSDMAKNPSRTVTSKATKS